jgi:hypothetical protein
MAIMKRLHVILISFLLAAAAVRAQAPSTTTISDVVYRADGTSASGTLLISWPAFESAGGQAVAAGSKSVTLAAGGAVNVALVPNEGATPSGTYYKVVYKLDEAVTNKDIVDEDKFRDGLGKVIDGVVECLNASAWAKKN